MDYRVCQEAFDTFTWCKVLRHISHSFRDGLKIIVLRARVCLLVILKSSMSYHQSWVWISLRWNVDWTCHP